MEWCEPPQRPMWHRPARARASLERAQEPVVPKAPPGSHLTARPTSLIQVSLKANKCIADHRHATELFRSVANCVVFQFK